MDCNAFDFETISDVVINLKYTARYGGDKLRDVARQAAVLPPPTPQPARASGVAFPAKQVDLRRLFSLKHEFPTDWYKFLNPPDNANSQSIQIGLGIDRFPYQYRGKKVQISQVEILLKLKDIHDPSIYKLNPDEPTPLGDYAAGGIGTALRLYLSPPVSTGAPTLSTALNSLSSFLGGLPYGSVPFGTGNPPGLGYWLLTAQNADIAKIALSLQNQVTSGGTLYQHLSAAPIDDIVIVCHYTAASL
jgi:hypothetical protein